jgi:ABC-type sugar transport system permease subunit
MIDPLVQNPVAFVVAALVAGLLGRTSRILRTVYFVPAVLSLVIIAKLWVDIFDPTFGILDEALRAVGLDVSAMSWLSDPRAALAAVVWFIVWQGFGHGQHLPGQLPPADPVVLHHPLAGLHQHGHRGRAAAGAVRD